MLFAICAYVGGSIGARPKRRLAALKGIYTDIKRLGVLMDYKALPIAELLDGLDGVLWRMLGAGLTTQNTVAEAFCTALQGQLVKGGELAWLEGSDVSILMDFGASLGVSDMKAQRANLEYTLKRLDESVSELTADVARCGRLYRSLGILSGIAAAIIVL